MASVSRRVKREVDRRFKKLNLTSTEDYVYCSMFEETFGQGEKSEKRNHRGDITISWIKENINKFITGIREYQRFKVKDTDWKRTIVQDVLLGGIRVAELIVRVIMKLDDEGNQVFEFEVIDGQQRITAFIEFFNDEFTIDVHGTEMTYTQMETQNAGLWRKFNELAFGAVFYENITNEEASIIFKKVNDQTDINCQEDRNAIFGPYSTYIADRTYYGSESTPLHSLFERQLKSIKNKKGKVTSKKLVLPNFPKLDISKCRMEQLEWYSHLIHWHHEGLRSTTTQDSHTFWQLKLDPYALEYNGKVKAEKLLKTANQIMESASPDQKQEDITPMILQFMVLWFEELTKGDANIGWWSIVMDDYVNGFLSILDDYSKDSVKDEKRAENNLRCRFVGPETDDFGKPKSWMVHGTDDIMGKMKDLFGGHNLKAIETILQVLEHELTTNPEQFSALELDPIRIFDKSMVIEKWKEQGKLDAETGKPLDINNLAGDHIIAHKEGIKAGGVTTWENLQVISKNRNQKKGSSSQFLKMAA